MTAGVSPNVLVALIGAPAAFLMAIGTVYAVFRGTNKSMEFDAREQAYEDIARRPIYPPEAPTNRSRDYVTQAELREEILDLKADMRALEERQNAKLDLIVTLLRGK